MVADCLSLLFHFGRQHARVLHGCHRDCAVGVIAVATRGWGKTAVSLHLAAQAALSCAAADTCLWLTPVVDQFGDAWRAVRGRYRRHIARATRSDGRVQFRRAGALEFRSAFEPDHLRGKTYRAAIVDEAALISAEGWHSCIRPTQRRADDWYVLLTTPRGGDWVADLRRSATAFGAAAPDALAPSAPSADCAAPHRRRRGLCLLRFPAQWSPPAAVAAAAAAAAGENRQPSLRFADNVDPARIAAAQAELPAAVFEREYLCYFGANQAACFSDIEGHIDDSLQPAGSAELAQRAARDGALHRYVLGVDWGFAQDYTAACVMERETGRVVEIYRQRRVGSAAMAAGVAELARRYGDAFCLCDVTGLQDQALALLQEQGGWAMGYIFSAPSKTDLIEHCLVAWERRRVWIPRHGPLLAELQRFESSYQPATRQRRYGAAPGVNRHDDCVIALALAWWATTHYPADLRAPQPTAELRPVDWEQYFL